MEAHEGFYRKQQCVTAAGINHVNPIQPFMLLIEIFTENLVKLNAQKPVSTADYHPDITAESNIKHKGMLGLRTNMYKKHEKRT